MAPGKKKAAQPAKEVEVEEDDLDLGSDSEAASGFGSDHDVSDDEGAEEGSLSGEEGEEESGEGDEAQEGEASAGEGDDDEADDDGRSHSKFGGSKVLARMAKDQTVDMNELKQRIHDDATLLANWRKAKEMGEKRTRAEVFADLVGNCSTFFGYAEELAEYFLQMFSPETAVKFFEANEQQRPLTIRTNSLKARRSSLIQALTARKVQVDPIGAWTKVGLKVYDSAVPVGATPEYLGGQYMIQSASSLVPVMALAPQQNETVLDMAAAPGGKTTYIGQLMRNTGTLFANDLRKDRCKSLVANIHRMGLTNAIVTNCDGRKLQDMLPKLDRVLLDAPCTGSGIIARDPSVKVKRGPKDFEEHSKLQKELLMTAIDMVDARSKTGGYIVYSTCSCAVEEDEAVIDHVLKVRNVELVSFESAVNFGVEGLTKYRERRFHPSLNLCRRYYPHIHNMDGFFVAKLKKTSNEIPERAKKDRSKIGDSIQNWGEEKWTQSMMESVVDFTKQADGTSTSSNRPLNKVERKKIKRAEKLRTVAAAAANGVDATKEESKKRKAEAAPAAAAAPEGDERRKKKKKGAAEAAPEAKSPKAAPVASPKAEKQSSPKVAPRKAPVHEEEGRKVTPAAPPATKKKRRAA